MNVYVILTCFQSTWSNSTDCDEYNENMLMVFNTDELLAFGFFCSFIMLQKIKVFFLFSLFSNMTLWLNGDQSYPQVHFLLFGATGS